MSDDDITMSGFLREVKDITHKPKRLQSDNLKAGRPEDKKEVSNIPVTITIERAIKFYETEALHGDKDPSLKLLYFQTAKWLRDHMNRNRKPEDDLSTMSELNSYEKEV